MDGDCFNCMDPASDRYTLVLDSEKVLEDKIVCGDCATEFREEDWIELRDSGLFEDD